MTDGWATPPPMSRSCDLCGHVGTDVQPALHRVRGRYEAIDKCRDRLACDDRRRAVEASRQ